MIKRYIEADVIEHLAPGKVIVITGPRQTGKTTFLHQLKKTLKEEPLWLSGEDRNIQSWLGSQSINTLRENIGQHGLVIIDEAQKVPEIGLNLKLIVDHLSSVKVIATGSSAFDLASQTGEPLVGRKWDYQLYPVSQLELSADEAPWQTKEMLPSRLIYGAYPAVVTASHNRERQEILQGIVNSYLLKDILALDNIRKSGKLIDLLSLLAFQIGQEVSQSELSNNLDLEIRTVQRYLDLLEKVFVIKEVRGFSRNLRKEISKTSRYYFIDNGIRNALINNFNDLNLRDDTGQLWENYLFMERLKKKAYTHLYSNDYFWRTYDQKKIDLIEERAGKLFGYEFKWQSGLKSRGAKLFTDTYPEAQVETINQENYLKFIS